MITCAVLGCNHNCNGRCNYSGELKIDRHGECANFEFPPMIDLGLHTIKENDK